MGSIGELAFAVAEPPIASLIGALSHTFLRGEAAVIACVLWEILSIGDWFGCWVFFRVRFGFFTIAEVLDVVIVVKSLFCFHIEMYLELIKDLLNNY